MGVKYFSQGHIASEYHSESSDPSRTLSAAPCDVSRAYPVRAKGDPPTEISSSNARIISELPTWTLKRINYYVPLYSCSYFMSHY